MNTERYKSHGNQFMKRRTIRKLYMNNDTPWLQIYGAWKLLLSTSSSPYPFFTILFVLFLFLFLLLSLISLLILLILHFLLSHFPFLLHLLFFIIFLDYSLVSERSHSPPLRKRKGRALTLIAGVDFEWTECSN